MPVSEVTSPTRGIVGWLHEVECTTNDSVLIFQLPRTTQQLSNIYVDAAKESIAKMLPPGRSALIIGCDVNIYEIASADFVALKLKGLL